MMLNYKEKIEAFHGQITTTDKQNPIDDFAFWQNESFKMPQWILSDHNAVHSKSGSFHNILVQGDNLVITLKNLWILILNVKDLDQIIKYK